MYLIKTKWIETDETIESYWVESLAEHAATLKAVMCVNSKSEGNLRIESFELNIGDALGGHITCLNVLVSPMYD